jgi:catechol-2,3-dioxygenase
VLNVRSLAISAPFYCEALGLKEVGRNVELRIAFLSYGLNDHDVGLQEVGRTADRYDGLAVGLQHVAFRIGDKLEELRRFRARLEARRIKIKRIDEHVASTSIYFSDPDGIELEAYIEHPPKTWRGKPQAKRFARPVRLD